MNVRKIFSLMAMLSAVAIAGCGGGGGGGSTPAPTPTSKVSGVASKGPLTLSTVNVYAIRNGAEDRSAPIGQGQTDTSGNYSIDLGSYTGPVLVEVTGGTYTDEVSAATVTLKSPLRALMSNVAAGTKTVAVTPLTEMAYGKALGTGSLTVASIDDANGKIAAFYKLTDIISTLPLAGGASDDQKKYAFVLGSFAQLVNDNKNTGETLDDALPRLLTQMSNEVKNDGTFSIGTILQVNSAISAFTIGGKNQTGSSITPLPTPTSGILKLSSAGTSAAIGGIDIFVNLPSGIRISADAVTGETTSGVVTISGVASPGDFKLSLARLIPASGQTPAQLHIILANTSGFGLGEFATIKFDLDAGASFPASPAAFTIASFSAVGVTSTTLNGITASPTFVGAGL